MVVPSYIAFTRPGKEVQSPSQFGDPAKYVWKIACKSLTYLTKKLAVEIPASLQKYGSERYKKIKTIYERKEKNVAGEIFCYFIDTFC